MADPQLKNIKYIEDPNCYNLSYRDPNVGQVNPTFTLSDNDPGLVLDNGRGSYNLESSSDPPLPYKAGNSQEPQGGAIMKKVAAIQDFISDIYDQIKKQLWIIIYAVLLMLCVAYFIYAMIHEQLENENSVRLLWVTCLIVFCVMCWLVYKYCGANMAEATSECTEVASKHSETISWTVVGLIYLFIIIFVIVDVVTVSKQPYNLVPALGIVVFVTFTFVFSHSPAHVRWRPVAWGLALQFVFAIIILRWSFGYQAFSWLGDRVYEFLEHTDAGSKFLFGDAYLNHIMAMKALPVVIFFSTMISVLYYLGWMQVVIRNFAMVMQVTMGTTAGESLNAAGNVFIGMSECPLLVKPLIPKMTKSEIHAVMTGGFATIAGSVLGVYILFGAPANHMISASVMSAPAALAMAKLFWPETEQSQTTKDHVKAMEKGPERNLIEAASNGASAAISLIANIAVNLIAFIATLHFLDATLTWLGNRVGVEELTFEFITSYVLWPIAFLMGVNYDECRQVARLIGVKTFINEWVAYGKLGELIINTQEFTKLVLENNYTYETIKDDIIVHYPGGTNVTLEYGIINDRTLVISTYALCGFANFGSVGILIGVLSAMAPERKSDITQVAVRAMIAGNIACFMTAAIAGIFYTGVPV